MFRAVTHKIISVFMVILMMTLPTFPLLGKIEKARTSGCYIKSSSGSASSLKKLSALLAQMIEEIREDEESHGKAKGKDTGKEGFFLQDNLEIKYYLGCTTHPGVSTCSILSGHEQDVHLPPEYSC